MVGIVIAHAARTGVHGDLVIIQLMDRYFIHGRGNMD